MFMRMVEEAWMDVDATHKIMDEIGHMLREIKLSEGLRVYTPGVIDSNLILK